MEEGQQSTPSVFCVTDESRHLVVYNLPPTGVIGEAATRFRAFGEITEFHPIEEPLSGEFTDAMWIAYKYVQDARVAKKKMNKSYFMGHTIAVRYAPEFETIEETFEKLESRRCDVVDRLATIAKRKVHPADAAAVQEQKTPFHHIAVGVRPKHELATVFGLDDKAAVPSSAWTQEETLPLSAHRPASRAHLRVYSGGDEKRQKVGE